MSTPHNNIPDPGQYWPEAEALLDGHFRRKRRRRFLIWFFLLIGLASSYIFVQERTDDTTGPMQNVTTVQTTEIARSGKRNDGGLEAVSMDKSAITHSDEATPNTLESASGSNAPALIADRAVNPTAKGNIQPLTRAVDQPVKQSRPRTETKERNRITEPRVENLTTDHTITTDDNPYGYSDDHVAVQSDDCEDVAASPEPTTTSAVFSVEAGVPVTEKSLSDSTLVMTIPAKQRNSGLLIRTGLMQTRADLHGEVDPGYIDRRRLEETPCLSPTLSVHWFNTRGNWDIRVGAGISHWGEESSYSPYTRQKYTNTTSVWQPYNYTLVDTDSAYVYGMLYYQTSNVVVNDSLLVTSTDTLYGLLPDTTLAGSLPCVKHTLIQIPIELAWTHRIGKFGIGVSAGLSIGWMIRSSGSYLRADQTGLADWNNSGKSGMFMQAGAALEFSYRISERISVLLMPAGNTALSSVKEPLGLKKRYSTWGLQAGLRFVLE